MDKFRRMEIFVAIVEAGQLTRAADTLLLSKSAVSHALTDLEKYLDLQLIVRNNRKWQLTDAGSAYYAQSKKILADVATMEDSAREGSQSLSGLIRLSAPGTFGSYTLAPVIAKFMEIHPDIVIELNLTDSVVDLIEARVDIAFRTGFLKDDNFKKNLFEVHTIGQASTMICASPNYLEKFGAPDSHLDLKNHKCIRYTRSPTWIFMKNGRRYEFLPKDHLMTDSGETMREFCIRGQGLALMPSSLAAFAVKKGRLLGTLKDYDCGTMPVQAVRVRGNRAPTRVVQLLHFITRELRSRPQDISEFVW